MKKRSNSIVSLIPNKINRLGGGKYRLNFYNVYHPQKVYSQMSRYSAYGKHAEFLLNQNIFFPLTLKIEAIILSVGKESSNIYIKVKEIHVLHVYDRQSSPCDHSNEKLSPNYYSDENGSSDLLTHINQIFPIDQVRGFYKIVIFKYIKRYQKKNGVEDLKKANTYLQRLIKLEEKCKD